MRTRLRARNDVIIVAPRSRRQGLRIRYFYTFCLLVCLLLLTGYWFLPVVAEESFVYDSHGRRDPFVPLVGAASKATVTSIEDIMSIEDVQLQGIASDSAGRMFAIINGEIIKKGQTIGRLTLKELSRYKVKLVIDESEHTVNIYGEENE